MEFIVNSMKDIDSLISIYESEISRLCQERDKEQKVDPYKISSIDYTKPFSDKYKKYDTKVRDDEYIKELTEKIEKFDECLEFYKNKKSIYLDTLSKMDGIEYRLYSYILKGYNPTKAIDMVAEENYTNGIKPSTQMGIMPYYKNMKKKCKL